MANRLKTVKKTPDPRKLTTDKVEKLAITFAPHQIEPRQGILAKRSCKSWVETHQVNASQLEDD